MKLRKSRSAISALEKNFFKGIARLNPFRVSNHARSEAMKDRKHLFSDGMFEVGHLRRLVINGEVVEISYETVLNSLRFMMRGEFDDYLDFIAVFEVGKNVNTVVTVFLNRKTDDHEKSQTRKDWQGSPIEIAKGILSGSSYVNRSRLRVAATEII